MKPVAFGTDGIRGKVGTFPINEEGFKIIGRACRLWLQRQDLPLTVAVGWDTRRSGSVLARAFTEGMGSGAEVTFLGVTPTPAISFYTQHKQISLGVSITASHNPYTDNGLKLFKSNGSKLRREEEAEIETLCSETSAEDFGSSSIQTVSGSDYYLNVWKQQLPKDMLKDRKVVLDTANGATVFTTLPLLRYLGADLITFGSQPNGENINRDCGSEYADRLEAVVKQNGAWLGFAHDGDGDRLVVIDEQGQRLDGDQLLGLLALDFHERKWLKNNCLVVTEESNSGLAKSLQPFGIRVATCDVGDRNVFYKLEEDGAILGGENSGHVIFKDEAPTGDGLRALLKLLKLAQQKPLHERAQAITLYAKCTASLTVADKRPLEQLLHLNAMKERLEKTCDRIRIRYSGTEAKLRFLVEAETQMLCEQTLAHLTEAARADFQR
ncbi:MAG: phosphoglucosamine mutase [Opitutales bacterium]|nr:phosphoglucosamine mutase [Opitutales bacterium]